MRGAHILLVEDDHVDRELFHAALKDRWSDQYVIHDAATVREASAAMESTSFDAVVVDLGLPDAQGTDAVNALAARGAPIIVLTGRADGAAPGESLDAGAADFLSKKHVTEELLERTLRYAILRHGRRAGIRPPLALSILHIEDDPGDQELVQATLASANLPVQYNAVESLRGAEGLLPASHLVLLDLNLPDSRGAATVTSLRHAAPHASIIVVTQVDDLDHVRAAIEQGASDYLVKGLLMPEQLQRAIAFAVEERAWEEA